MSSVANHCQVFGEELLMLFYCVANRDFHSRCRTNHVLLSLCANWSSLVEYITESCFEDVQVLYILIGKFSVTK